MCNRIPYHIPILPSAGVRTLTPSVKTDPGNPPAVRVEMSKTVCYILRPGQKPDPVCLGGVVTRTGPKRAVFWPAGTWTAGQCNHSYDFHSNEVFEILMYQEIISM
jgi:hypothetical protein